MTPADPIPPPVTPEPLSAFTAEQVRATSLKWRKAADSIAATSRDRETADMLDAFADLLEARAARPSPWQPIETAPKDGTCVLLLCPHGQYVSWWDTEPIEWWMVSDNKFEPRPIRGAAPTHWQPLPAPPGSGGRRP